MTWLWGTYCLHFDNIIHKLFVLYKLRPRGWVYNSLIVETQSGGREWGNASRSKEVRRRRLSRLGDFIRWGWGINCDVIVWILGMRRPIWSCKGVLFFVRRRCMQWCRRRRDTRVNWRAATFLASYTQFQCYEWPEFSTHFLSFNTIGDVSTEISCILLWIQVFVISDVRSGWWLKKLWIMFMCSLMRKEPNICELCCWNLLMCSISSSTWVKALRLNIIMAMFEN